MKKFKKGLLASLTAAVFCMTAFTGCGSDKDSTTTESKTTTEETTTEASTTEDATPDTPAVPTLNVSLNVYYNDADHNFYDNVMSNNTVAITEDGQYTLTFDCASDLSDDAKAAGITNLTNLTAIYIKDYDVNTGAIAISPLESCDIKYDKITVNDTDLTITATDAKSALKDSGIFDTNDPINGWDGSAVEEAESTGDHVANFTTVENPTKITVTFTISNLKFK